MSTIFTAAPRSAGFAIGLRPVSALHLLSLAVFAYGVQRQRRRLTDLSDTQLADIGLTRAAADREAARPFWDLPARQPGPR